MTAQVTAHWQNRPPRSWAHPTTGGSSFVAAVWFRTMRYQGQGGGQWPPPPPLPGQGSLDGQGPQQWPPGQGFPHAPAPGEASSHSGGAGEILYEGRQHLPKRLTRPRTLTGLTATFGISALAVPLLYDVTLLRSVTYLGPVWVFLVVFFVLWRRGRIQITAEEVRVLSWHRKRIIPRRAIGQTVYVRRLPPPGTYFQGYIALMDHEGQALWRAPSAYWPAETVQALLNLGHGPVVLERLTPAQARAWWPGLLRWDYANPGKYALVIFGVLLLGIAIAAGLLAVFTL